MKYDYGDEVIVNKQGGIGNTLERRGTVVGISPMENAEHSRIFEYPVGTILYTVEFDDGSDTLVPDNCLTSVVREN